MTALEEGLAELARADWPWRIVEACMFVHARGDHVGWTYGGDGRARCGLDGCGWGISARSDDPAIERARFAIAALGTIGLVFAMVAERAGADFRFDFTDLESKRADQPAAAGWLPAFRLWLKQWRQHPLDPEWLRAYRKAFRAGWRAALRHR